MKKGILLVFAVSLLNCSSGDLQIETLDFNAASIQYCGSLSTATQVFFKLNDREALILELQSGLLQNTPSENTISSAIPSQSQLRYRAFSGTVDSGYFCDVVPPVDPVVIEEISAAEGNVLISTVQNPSDTTQFTHTISLEGVSFVNAAGERLTNLALEDFGEIITSED
jgi:hypothetical protein